MSLYARLSTDALTDAKIIAAGIDGFTLWAKGLLYSKQHLTDGVVPAAALSLIGIGMPNPKKAAQKLVSIGLWQECEGGYRVDSEKWAKHQTTREQVETKREFERARKAEARAKKKGCPTVVPLGHTTCPSEVVPRVSTNKQSQSTESLNTEDKSSERTEPFQTAERVLSLVNKTLKWEPPTRADVLRNLKEDSPIQVLAKTWGVDGAAELFIWAYRNWNKPPTWPSVFDQRNQIREQIKGTSNGSGNGKELPVFAGVAPE